MSLKHWFDAFETTTFLINRMPTAILNGMTPLQKLFGTKPDFEAMRVFGYACFPLLRPYSAHKLSYRFVESVFMGYSLKDKGYKCLDIATNRLNISQNIVFNEMYFPFSAINLSSSVSMSAPVTHTTMPAIPFFIPSNQLQTNLASSSKQLLHAHSPAHAPHNHASHVCSPLTGVATPLAPWDQSQSLHEDCIFLGSDLISWGLKSKLQ